MSILSADWDFEAPHVVALQVAATDIDAYGHVNNSVYLAWFDRVAWSHSTVLGISLDDCVRQRRGMAAHRTEVTYLRAAFLGDHVFVGTWIVSGDGRLRVERRFQVRRADQAGTQPEVPGDTLARARTGYVCINLDSGRAVRMPEPFSRAYRPTVLTRPKK
ncbi:MAG TPA: thioesterase family protein [Steroidobacteraceae bacterium]